MDKQYHVLKNIVKYGKRTFRNCRFYRSGDVLFTDMEVFKGQGNDTDTSEEFEKYLQDQGMLHSFSRKGNPYDNACIESFHSVLKKRKKYTQLHITHLRRLNQHSLNI